MIRIKWQEKKQQKIESGYEKLDFQLNVVTKYYPLTSQLQLTFRSTLLSRLAGYPQE